MQVFGGGPGSVFKPDVIYAMQQGKVRWRCHPLNQIITSCVCVCMECPGMPALLPDSSWAAHLERLWLTRRHAGAARGQQQPSVPDRGAARHPPACALREPCASAAVHRSSAALPAAGDCGLTRG